jgi:hypothetical protein
MPPLNMLYFYMRFSMRDENEPDQATHYGRYCDKNYYLLQHIHIFLLF